MNYGDWGNHYTTTTTYGAGGGAGGGGFLEGSQAGSQGSPSGGRDKKNTLRPLTIKQALEAQATTDDNFKVDEHDISHITLVAQIRNISEQSTYTTYKVDDGTGSLDIRHWVDPDAADDATEDLPPHLQANKPKLSENMYVRILGQLKMYKNKRMVAAHSIRAVKDFHEVLYHLMECTYTHLYLTRGPLEQPQQAPHEQAGSIADSGYGMAHRQHAYGRGGGGGGGDVPMGGMGHGNSGNVNNPGKGNINSLMARSDISMTAKRMLTVLAGADVDGGGMHIALIQQRLKIPMEDIGKARDEMLASGVVFSTIDDNHIAVL